jgi:SAM-dependent methyltransferase
MGAAQGTRYVSGSFFDYSAEPFDAIWEHTCFCAIDPSTRPLYAESCARLIRPGGVFAAVFYLEPWLADEIPEPPPYASGKEEIVELFSRNFDLIWEKVPTLSYPGREGREWLAVFGRIRRDREVAEGGFGR